jgi:hypothetical protein
MWCLAALAACGGSQRVESAAGSNGGAGCPTPLDVKIAAVETIDGAPSWALEEAVIADAENDTSAKTPGAEDELTADEARAHGASSGDGPIWIFADDDGEPCRALPRKHVAIRTAGAHPYTHVVRALDGCSAPKDPSATAFALETTDPGSCHFREPRLLSQRSDGNGATSLPPELEHFIPAKACDAPACDARWLIKVNDFHSGAAYYDAVVSWVYPQEDANECTWKVESYAGHFVTVEANAPTEPWPAPGNHAGIFYDGRGPRGIVTTAPGRFWVFEPADPLPRQVQDVTWGPSDGQVPQRSLGPDCD